MDADVKWLPIANHGDELRRRILPVGTGPSTDRQHVWLAQCGQKLAFLSGVYS